MVQENSFSIGRMFVRIIPNAIDRREICGASAARKYIFLAEIKGLKAPYKIDEKSIVRTHVYGTELKT